MSKKDFSRSTKNAAEKFISITNTQEIEETKNQKQQMIGTDVINNKNKIISTSVNKKRGKRDERCLLMLDKQLKEDLKNLANANGSRSINDFINNILLDYIELPINKELLKAYVNLQKIKNKDV